MGIQTFFRRIGNRGKPQGTEMIAGRAEAATSRPRIIERFADCGSLNQTVVAAPLETYSHLLDDLIARLQHEIGGTPEMFNEVVQPMVTRYLRYVHLLPASEGHHHARLGGLAEHGLDVAIRAARGADNKVFDFNARLNNDTELKTHRRQRWQVAAAAGGIGHDFGKVLIDLLVTDAETGRTWNPFASDMQEWFEQFGVTSYVIRYRPGNRLHRHESFSCMLAGQLMGREVMAFISELGRDMIEAVLKAVQGREDDPSGISTIVKAADAASCADDRAAKESIWTEDSQIRSPVINKLLDAGTAMLQSGNWTINQPDSCIWASEEGIYLLWPRALEGMRHYLEQAQQAMGIPIEPTEVAEIFIRSGMARPRKLSSGQLQPLWQLILAPPKTTKQQTSYEKAIGAYRRMHTALKLTDGDSLISGSVIHTMLEFSVAPDPTLETSGDDTASKDAQSISPVELVLPDVENQTIEIAVNDISPSAVPPPAAKASDVVVVDPNTVAGGIRYTQGASLRVDEVTGEIVSSIPATAFESSGALQGDMNIASGEPTSSSQDALISESPIVAERQVSSGTEEPQVLEMISIDESAFVSIDSAQSEESLEDYIPDIVKPAGSGNTKDDAILTFSDAGEFGETLQDICARIKLSPGVFQDKWTSINGTVLLVWPDGVMPYAKSISLPRWLLNNPRFVASEFNGQAIDVAQNGLTIIARVKGKPKNVIALCKELSTLFRAAVKS